MGPMDGYDFIIPAPYFEETNMIKLVRPMNDLAREAMLKKYPAIVLPPDAKTEHYYERDAENKYRFNFSYSVMH